MNTLMRVEMRRKDNKCGKLIGEQEMEYKMCIESEQKAITATATRGMVTTMRETNIHELKRRLESSVDGFGSVRCRYTPL